MRKFMKLMSVFCLVGLMVGCMPTPTPPPPPSGQKPVMGPGGNTSQQAIDCETKGGDVAGCMSTTKPIPVATPVPQIRPNISGKWGFLKKLDTNADLAALITALNTTSDSDLANQLMNNTYDPTDVYNFVTSLTADQRVQLEAVLPFSRFKHIMSYLPYGSNAYYYYWSVYYITPTPLPTGW